MFQKVGVLAKWGMPRAGQPTVAGTTTSRDRPAEAQLGRGSGRLSGALQPPRLLQLTLSHGLRGPLGPDLRGPCTFVPFMAVTPGVLLAQHTIDALQACWGPQGALRGLLSQAG